MDTVAQDRGHFRLDRNPGIFRPSAEASHGDLGLITPNDAIMALSWPGETRNVKTIIDYSRRFRIPLIAFTANADSALGRAADLVLTLPQAREAWTGSTIVGCWSPSATFRRRKPRNVTMPCWKSQPWRYDSNEMAFGKLGAFSLHLRLSMLHSSRVFSFSAGMSRPLAQADTGPASILFDEFHTSHL